MPDRPASSPVQLVKGLGPYATTAVVAGTIIGTGIFIVPSLMLAHVGTPLKVVGVWVFAGALSLCGALGYAELAAALPQAGGEYVYLREAYGPGMGFLYGWTQFVVAKAASIATIATGFLLYLAYFFPGLARVVWQPAAGAGHAWNFKLTGLQLGSALLIVLISGLNVLGVRRSGAVQTVFTVAKLSVLATVIVLGLLLGRGSFGHFSELATNAGAATTASSGYLLAMVSALWAYDGWNNLSMVAAEVQNPQRNMPRALIIGSLIVLAVYLLANLVYFYILTPNEAVATSTIAITATRRFLGNGGANFVAVGVLISIFAALNGSVLSGSRIPYAQARDGLFPQSLARVNPRFHTPAVAIAAQAVLASLFALTGAYETLYTKAIYSEWIFYALVTAGLLILRRRRPELSRPYRTWGYPVVPLAFVAIAALLLGDTLRERPVDAIWCLGLVASGIPAYAIWKRLKRKSA